MKNLKASRQGQPLSDPHSTPEAAPPCQHGSNRRGFLEKAGIGALLASMSGMAFALVRSLVPNVLYEQPQRFKAGPVDSFPEGATFLENQRVFIFRNDRTFHAVSAVCTHLGCTVKMVRLMEPKLVNIGGRRVEEQHEFHCPCHGSRYYGDGTNYAGPAPKPLACLEIAVSPDDGSLVVDLSKPVARDFRLTV